MTMTQTQPAAYVREHWSKWYRRDLLHMAYWPKYVASQTDWVNTDIDQIVRDMVDGGITLLSWGGPENWFPIDSGMQQRHPALNQRTPDFFDELIDKCHACGIKVLLGFSGNGGREGKARFIQQNWDAFRKQGADWQIPGIKLGGHEVCLLNPLFVEGERDAVRALCERYPFDATFIDQPTHRVPVDPASREITCEYCRDTWRKLSSMDKAPAEDWDDPRWRRFVEWQSNISVGYLQTLVGAIKGVDDRILVTANMISRPVDSAAASTPNPASMRGVIDSMCYESVFLTFNLMDVQLNLKFGHATTGHNPGCILKNFELIFGQGYAHAEPSALETETLAYLSLAHGSAVMIHSTMDELGRPHPLRTRVYVDVCRKLQRDLPYFTDATPLTTVGVAYSRLTRDNYAGRNPSSFLASYHGAEQVLVYNHAVSRQVLDEDITDEGLDGLRTLLLPNVACMSDRSVDAVRRFVERGGTVIASYETSLYDENERFRGDFALADAFGIRHNGVLPLAEKIHSGVERWNRQPFHLRGHSLLEGLGDSEILHVPWFSVQATSAETMARWYRVREGLDQGSVNMAREIIGEYDEPCITINRYGKGRAIYFSGDIFYGFSLRPLRYFTQMFRKLLLGTGSLQVWSDAPKSLELTLMEQPDDGRINVHLVNMVNTNRWYNGLVYSHRHPKDLARSGDRDDFGDDRTRELAMAYRVKTTFDTTGPIDEVLPLHDVNVYLEKRLTDGRTVTLHNGERAELHDAGQGFIRVTVPEVTVYSRITLQNK